MPRTKYSSGSGRSLFYFPYTRNADGVDSLIGHHATYSSYEKYRAEVLRILTPRLPADATSNAPCPADGGGQGLRNIPNDDDSNGSQAVYVGRAGNADLTSGQSAAICTPQGQNAAGQYQYATASEGNAREWSPTAFHFDFNDPSSAALVPFLPTYSPYLLQMETPATVQATTDLTHAKDHSPHAPHHSPHALRSPQHAAQGQREIQIIFDPHCTKPQPALQGGDFDFTGNPTENETYNAMTAPSTSHTLGIDPKILVSQPSASSHQVHSHHSC